MINLLTMVRVALLLPLAWLLLTTREQSLAGMIIFMVSGLTDMLDGYLARKLQKITLFGAMLDQICDKIFIIGTLVAMAAAGLLENLMLVPVFLIIAREFAVAGLREYAAINRHRLPVDKLGKYKTATQFLAIAWMLMPPMGIVWMVWINHAGAGLLWIAAILGIVSAARYAISVTKSISPLR
jgi:CDP-diacylglycerol--glycerol-3-phosphate 3-phosphatidyltransferase